MLADVRKYNYKLVMGEEPSSITVFRATRWTDLRAKLAELQKGDWLKVEFTGEEAARGCEHARQACYNWGNNPDVNLAKSGLCVQTRSQRMENGDVTMWARIINTD